MNVFVLVCIAVAMIAVLAVMGLGIFSMVKGGAFNNKYANKLMQARVYIQGVAIALLGLAYLLSKH